MTDHLAKAREYIGRGEEFYRKAATELRAAKNEGRTWPEIADAVGRSVTWVRDLVRWYESPANGHLDHAPFGGPAQDAAQTKSRGTKYLRETPPEQIAEVLASDPAIRENVGRALDRHYAAKSQASKQRAEKREVEQHGGTEEHAAFQRRQRIAEVVNVARGLTTGMRFVVEEVRRLNLDEFEEAGVRDELVTCASEVEGFAVLLRQFLSGVEITDADIATFIGEPA